MARIAAIRSIAKVVPSLISFTELSILGSFNSTLSTSKAINHRHKKRKNSLEGGLDRVLFAAELEFSKILVLKLPQHTSDVNIECAGKSEWSKQLYFLYLTSFLEHCI